MEKVFQKIVENPVPKILAVGKNYAKHVVEMGGTKAPEDPVIFMKPPTSLIPPNFGKIILNHNRQLHHEIELGFIIKKQAVNVKNIKIEDYVGGYFLALDLTDRKLQSQFKKQGFPWDLAKGQDASMPVSSFIPFEKIKNVDNLDLEFKINGNIIQSDNTKNMIYKIPYLIEFCSQYMTLNPGDMIITGTPSGVGPIKHEDKIEAFIKQNGVNIAEIIADVVQPLQKL